MQEKEVQALRHWFEETGKLPEAQAELIVMTLVAALEERREKIGLTYAEIGRELGYTRAHISKLMKGSENATVLTLVKLAQALGCEIAVDLFVGKKKLASARTKEPAMKGR